MVISQNPQGNPSMLMLLPMARATEVPGIIVGINALLTMEEKTEAQKREMTIVRCPLPPTCTSPTTWSSVPDPVC